MRILGQCDAPMREVLTAALEVGHARLDFIFPAWCHTDVAALNSDFHMSSLMVFAGGIQQTTCLS
jgi:hypothetical protein